MKRISSVLALMTFLAAPVQGQSIVDTFKQLRSTVKQLGGEPKPPGQRGSEKASATGPATQADDGAMVSAAMLVDDPSDTAIESTPLVARRVASFDIRGFRLGMSPREVGRIGDRQRFRRRWNDLLLTSGTFEVEAARVANFRLNRPVEKTSKVQLKASQGIDPDGNEVKLEFTLEPTGPKLSRIEYRARLDGTTASQAFDALSRRYGPPNDRNDDGIQRSWSNARGPVDNSSPSLVAIVDGGRMALTLTQSVDYEQAAKKRLDDRAQAIAAARGGGVRF